jgi:hypothetical protein
MGKQLNICNPLPETLVARCFGDEGFFSLERHIHYLAAGWYTIPHSVRTHTSYQHITTSVAACINIYTNRDKLKRHWVSHQLRSDSATKTANLYQK